MAETFPRESLDKIIKANKDPQNIDAEKARLEADIQKIKAIWDPSTESPDGDKESEGKKAVLQAIIAMSLTNNVDYKEIGAFIYGGSGSSKGWLGPLDWERDLYLSLQKGPKSDEWTTPRNKNDELVENYLRIDDKTALWARIYTHREGESIKYEVATKVIYRKSTDKYAIIDLIPMVGLVKFDRITEASKYIDQKIEELKNISNNAKKVEKWEKNGDHFEGTRHQNGNISKGKIIFQNGMTEEGDFDDRGWLYNGERNTEETLEKGKFNIDGKLIDGIQKDMTTIFDGTMTWSQDRLMAARGKVSFTLEGAEMEGEWKFSGGALKGEDIFNGTLKYPDGSTFEGKADGNIFNGTITDKSGISYKDDNRIDKKYGQIKHKFF